MTARVCYLLSSFGYTGGSMVLYRFMDKLCERGYEVVAVTPDERVSWKPSISHDLVRSHLPPPPPTPRADGWGRTKNAVKRLPGIRTLAARRAAAAAARLPPPPSPIEEVQRMTEGLLRNWVPSEFTIGTFCTTAYAAYALADRTVSLYHMQHYEEVFFDDDLRRKVARLTYFLPIELIANSSWLKDRVRGWIGRESELLLPGIDVEVFHPRGASRRKYVDGGKFTVVSYYSPARFKAWEDAVACMRSVYARLGVEAVEWKVYGPVPEAVPDIPVNFVGLRFGAALADLYAEAHAAMTTSWYESFPLPPLEAMACGTAVVTTGVGLEDYVQPGVNALVVPARHPEAMTEAIISLVRNPRLAARLADSGIMTAQRFSWDRATDRLEEILHRSRGSTARASTAEISEFLSGP